ncbi:hypothetical protein G3164_005067 [Salmonella enterica subsp. enterica serovar Montevideo]|nr:hypothetical protein [Salmonella enterica subsp. enterica serovar Montevideo]EEK7814261.1 hypothetical protein [Salmonella enterica subsp. enterica serovar Montevideo]EEL0143508.1 hypothetical protein [Salmonella enterica subsp. enterica serovar Montevideo]
MTKTTNKGLQVTVDPEIASEMAYMLKLQQTCGAAVQLENVEGLIHYILANIADGSRRPGSLWRASPLRTGSSSWPS